MDASIFLCLCLSLLIFLRLYKKRFGNSAKFPPGPTAVPFFGNIFLVKKLSKKYRGLHGAFQQLSKKYRTPILGLYLGSTPTIVFFSRKHIKLLFSEESFQGRPDNLFTRLRTMGERRGITILDGPVFHDQRKFAVRHLSQLGFQKASMKNLIQRELMHLLEHLQPRTENRICINELLTSSVLNVIWTFVAGRRFSIDDPFILEWFSLFNERGKLFDLSGGLLALFPWIRFLAPEKSGYNLILNINGKLKKFIDEEIARHKLSKPDNPNDFIDVYLEEIASNPDSPVFNEDQLVAVCLDFFIAGLHTTSDTLTFALIAMVKFPQIQAKVQEYLDSVLKIDEKPIYDQKSRFPYIEAVLLESMRYMHVVPFIGPRRVMNDIIVDGYLLPKDATILGNLDDYYHSVEVWGDPENFRPERFLNSNGEVVSEEKYFFFGRGARSCVGDMLAKQFVFTFFSGILHTYEISLAPGTEMPAEIPGITTKPEPFWISLKSRKQ